MSFLSSLWQLAQLALNNFLPASALTSAVAEMLKMLIAKSIKTTLLISEA
jgi:hypothetical protein